MSLYLALLHLHYGEASPRLPTPWEEQEELAEYFALASLLPSKEASA